jgi:hypothetical protein
MHDAHSYQTVLFVNVSSAAHRLFLKRISTIFGFVTQTLDSRQLLKSNEHPYNGLAAKLWPHISILLKIASLKLHH